MKITALVGISVLFCCWSQAALAQRELPRGIKPAGNVDLRLVAGFQSKCKVGNVGGLEATNSVELKPNGQLSYVRRGSAVGQAIALELGVKPDGRGFDDGPMKVGDTFVALVGEAMRQETGTNLYTQTLTQDTEIKTDMCRGFGGTDSETDRFFSVLGTTFLSGRHVLVVGGNRHSTCRISGNPVVMASYGWEAFDIESGLLVERSVLSAVGRKNGDMEQSGTDNWSCSLTKTSETTKPNSATPPSVEMRLIELKKLLDSGLISQQIFDKKSQDILKDF